MTPKSNPKKLGEIIYKAREAIGMPTRELAERIGLNRSTLNRLQIGKIAQPRPALLARIAEELQINVGELYALAGYQTEDQLPDLSGWLNIRHRSLPDEAVEALQSHLDDLVNKHESDAMNNQERKEET